MGRRGFSGVAILLSTMMVANSAEAGSRDVLLGIGAGIIGGAVLHGLAHPPQPQYQAPARQRAPASAPRRQQPSAEDQAARHRAAAERERVADIQARLNTLEFDAGTPDGVAGSQTRAAIRAFQMSLGHPQTGEMTTEQYETLKVTTSATPLPVQQAAPLPPAQDAPSAPLLSASTTAASVPGRVSFGTPERVVPDLDVFGIRPLDSRSDIRAKLSQAGFSDCREQGSTVSCSMATDTMSDTVLVALSGAPEASAYLVMRTVRLKIAAERGGVVNRMRERYAALVDAPDTLLASGEACRQQALPVVRAGMGSFTRDAANGGPGEQTLALAGVCDTFAAISVPTGERVDQISLALFSGRPLQPPAANAASAVNDIRF